MTDEETLQEIFEISYHSSDLFDSSVPIVCIGHGFIQTGNRSVQPLDDAGNFVLGKF